MSELRKHYVILGFETDAQAERYFKKSSYARIDGCNMASRKIGHIEEGHELQYSLTAENAKVERLERRPEIAVEALKEIYQEDLGDDDLLLEEEVAKEALAKIGGVK